MRLALAPVAGHARPVVDQRQLLADQPVEQGGLADVGAADDGDGGQLGHEARCPAAFTARRSTGRCRRGCRACCPRPPAAARSRCGARSSPGPRRRSARRRRSGRCELISTSRLPASTGPRQKIGSSPGRTLRRPVAISALAAPLRPAEGGELRDPADPARGAGDREQLRPVGDDEHPFARHPGRRDAGDVQFPGALAGDQLDRDHAPALADREDPAIVDHRIGVDVGKVADDGRDAGPRQRVLPDHLAVLVAIGGELARRIAGDQRALREGGGGAAEHAGQLERARAASSASRRWRR